MPSRPPNLKPRKRATRSSINWNRRESRQARGYGREHEHMREIVLREEPLCRECLKHNRITPTTVADHRIPKAEGGSDDRENYQGLCDPCSRAKTASEAARGRARNRPG
jgi:5-methylcytosine-specific restriction protein A